jgi:hypothetical protein
MTTARRASGYDWAIARNAGVAITVSPIRLGAKTTIERGGLSGRGSRRQGRIRIVLDAG